MFNHNVMIQLVYGDESKLLIAFSAFLEEKLRLFILGGVLELDCTSSNSKTDRKVLKLTTLDTSGFNSFFFCRCLWTALLSGS